MGNKKYILTDETKEINGVKLHRIQAIRSFGSVKEGDFGGWVEAEVNLSHEGRAWAYHESAIYGFGHVGENAIIRDEVEIYGYASLLGNVKAFDNVKVFGYVDIKDRVILMGRAKVFGSVDLKGRMFIRGHAFIRTNNCFWSASPVGSQGGTLTAYKGKDETIYVTRGCFQGSLQEFEKAVLNRHANNKCGKEYMILIEFIKLKLGRKEQIT